MKNKITINSLFKDKLVDRAVPEMDWNTPPEEIWIAAKPHFPKQKKKRRIAFLWPFGIGLLTSLLFITIIYAGAKSEILKTQPSDHTVNKTESIEIEEKVIVHKNSLDQNVSDENVDLSVENDGLKIEQVVDDSKIVSNQSTSIKESNKSIDKKDKLAVIKQETNSEIATGENIKDRYSITLNPLERNLQTEKTKVNKQLIPTSEINRSSLDETKLMYKKVESIKLEYGQNLTKSIPSLSISEFPLDFDLNISELNKPLVDYKLIRLSKLKPRSWEIGFSFASFIINPFSLIGEDLAKEEGSFDFTYKYKNANLHLNRQVSDRWSFISGLRYTQIGVDLNFQISEIYNTQSSSAKFKSIIDDKISGSVNINDVSAQLDLTLNTDNLQAGDTLIMSASVPLSLQVIQLPLWAQYRIAGKKLSWHVHAGMTLDVVKISIKPIDLVIRHEAEEVSELMEMKKEVGYATSFSTYFGTGLKYKLNNKFSIIANSNFNISEVALSRYDIGLLYRL